MEQQTLNSEQFKELYQQLLQKENILANKTILLDKREKELKAKEEENERVSKKRKEELQHKIIEFETQNKEIILNVGGKIFITLYSILTSEKNYFTELLSGIPMLDGSYVINRDAKYFHLILNHLKGLDILKKLKSLNDEELYDFIKEIQFYQIYSLMKILPEMSDVYKKKINIENSVFTKCGNDGELLNENKRINTKGENNKAITCGALGKLFCHHYKIKIIKIEEAALSLMVGFSSRSKFNCDFEFGFNSRCGWFLSNQGFKYFVDGSALFNKKINMNPGSVIEVIYDSKIETISCIIDGKDYGVVFDNVEDTGDICPAFNMFWEGIAFEFIDF
ncbi:hypothetical protein ABK040_008526 [Willaertia magna]